MRADSSNTEDVRTLRTRAYAGVAIVALAFSALGAGCAGTLEDPERFASPTGGGVAPDGLPRDPTRCPDVAVTVFGARCVNAGCHNADDRTQGLDLQSPDVGTRLMGKRASGGAGFLIDPEGAAKSVLYRKLTKNPPFGARMPLSGTLDDGTVACVLAWIDHEVNGDPQGDAGASNDAPKAD